MPISAELALPAYTTENKIIQTAYMIRLHWQQQYAYMTTAQHGGTHMECEDRK